MYVLLYILILSILGGACRSRVTKKLGHNFINPADAERHFKDLFEQSCTIPSNTAPSVAVALTQLCPIDTCASEASASSLTTTSHHSLSPIPTDILLSPMDFSLTCPTPYSVARACQEILQPLESRDQLTVLSMLLSTVAAEEDVPSDFLHLVICAMKNLRSAGRSNSLYFLAKGLGNIRKDGSDSLFPAKRMPMGLIEYAAKFFTATSVQQV